MFLKWLSSKRKKQKIEPVSTIVKEPKKEVRDIKMSGSYENGFMVLEIGEKCDILEYAQAIEKNNLREFEYLLTNHTLFDHGINNISKKRVYMIRLEDRVYNIYSNDEQIFIDERLWQDNGHIFEHLIEIKKASGHYTIHLLKHDEILSTYFVKSHTTVPKTNDYDKDFRLDIETATNIAKSTINNLRSIPNIETIIDIDELLTRLFDDSGALLSISETPSEKLSLTNQE